MKKFQIFFATLALTLLAASQSLQAQTITYKQSGQYLVPAGGDQGSTTLQPFTYTSYSQKAGLDVMGSASVDYEVYTRRSESDQWTLVDRRTGVTNVPDAYATNGYDAYIGQPDAYQMRVVVYARTGGDFMLTFMQ